MTKKKVKSQPEEKVPLVATVKKPQVKKEVVLKPAVVPKPKVVLKASIPIPQAPELEVDTMEVIQSKMKIINAKLQSKDLNDVEEGHGDLKVFTQKLREDSKNIDLKAKFLGNV